MDKESPIIVFTNYKTKQLISFINIKSVKMYILIIIEENNTKFFLSDTKLHINGKHS